MCAQVALTSVLVLMPSTTAVKFCCCTRSLASARQTDCEVWYARNAKCRPNVQKACRLTTRTLLSTSCPPSYLCGREAGRACANAVNWAPAEASAASVSYSRHRLCNFLPDMTRQALHLRHAPLNEHAELLPPDYNIKSAFSKACGCRVRCEALSWSGLGRLSRVKADGCLLRDACAADSQLCESSTEVSAYAAGEPARRHCQA